MTENSPKRDLAVATRAIPLLRSDFEVSTAAAILLKQWMARKGVESANRLKAAIAENYRLQALVAQEELNLIETEELFKHLDSIKEMVSFKVQADVEEQKERLNRLKRDNDLADELSQNAKLKVKAEREEIRADTLQASVRIMQLEEKLTGKKSKNNIGKKIKKAEKQLQKIQHEEITTKDASGGSLSEEAELDFEIRKAKIIREINNLYDQKHKQDYENSA